VQKRKEKEEKQQNQKGDTFGSTSAVGRKGEWGTNIVGVLSPLENEQLEN